MFLGKKIQFAIALSLFSIGIFAQIGGNQVYDSDRDYDSKKAYQNRISIHSTDTSAIISVRVLKNTPANLYSLTFAIAHQATSVQAAQKAADTQINAFLKGLGTLSVLPKDIYVDYIGVNKIYDYEINGNRAEEKEKGFELKKNVIINLTKPELIEKIIALAAENGIFDLVKADYFDSESEKSHTELFNTAINLVNERKTLYSKGFPDGLPSKYRIVSENFYAISPKVQYNHYTPAETAQIYDSYNDRLTKIKARKTTTFYFEGKNPSDFDSFSGIENPEVSIQYVLELSVYFDLKKDKSK
ncbi:MAG TPA: hypothetical protein DCQ31_15835 [Bacteroidales bacterium]|nr:hypothetical protein [Bacteroidales bacterium]